MLTAAEIRGREETAREESPTREINVGEAERMASNLGGGVLIAAGLVRGGLSGLTLAGLGGMLLYRGLTGHCRLYSAMGMDTSQTDHGQRDATEFGVPAQAGTRVIESITIDRPADELYDFWRKHENLPSFQPYIRSVTSGDGMHSHWVMETPIGATLEWDAAIQNEDPGRLIAWASTGGQLAVAGSVHFDPAPGGRGTEVTLIQKYDPPLGKVGLGIAKLLGMSPSGLARESLRRFKQLMETGEIPTVEGQPSGRRSSS
jgi:uncharacterized membrane protein